MVKFEGKAHQSQLEALRFRGAARDAGHRDLASVEKNLTDFFGEGEQ